MDLRSNRPLVRIVKDWEWAGLLRQTPGQTGRWGEFQFTLDPVEECDFLIMLNNRKVSDTVARCPKENVWALMQEPYVEGLYDWMIEGHECYTRVLTHYLPSDDPKYLATQPAIPWHVTRTFDELVSMPIPNKSKPVSWVTSRLSFLPGHKKKLAFLKCLQQQRFPIDLFGRGIRYIEDKWDGLASYRYSLAIENSRGPDYWTEKVADCFLTWTIPIYDGCTNLEKYFPSESFIRIDIEDPEASLSTIKAVIEGDDWEQRLPALDEARNLVLYRYQLFPYLSAMIQSYTSAESYRQPAKNEVRIPGYRSRRQIHRARYIKNKVMMGEFPDLVDTLVSKFRYAVWEMRNERVM